MRKFFTLFAAITLCTQAFAQLNGNGYYRAQNDDTERYLVVTNNYAKASASTTEVDVTASLQTLRGFNTVASDCASVLYFEQVDGENKWIIHAQGIDTYTLTGYYLKIGDMRDGTYTAYASASGMTKFLTDENWTGDEGFVFVSQDDYKYWRIKPVNQAEDQYFGVNPTVNAGGYYWKTFFSDFSFSATNNNLQAFAVTTVDTELGVAVIDPINGPVAAKTPVVLRSTMTAASDNRLNVGVSGGTTIANNKLTGVFFDNVKYNPTNNVPNDPTTMRLIGLTSKGEVGFVKSNLQVVPRNNAYLKVAANCPAELKIVTREEYNTLLNQAVTVRVNSFSRGYGEANPTFTYSVEGGTLRGTPVLECAATQNSPVGEYAITASKGSVTNSNVTFVAGTLTINRAPLTIRMGEYTKKQGDPLPEMKPTYDGFRLGETAAVLTTQPVVATSCDQWSKPSDDRWAVTVSGAEAQNYAISYQNGWLKVVEGDPMTVSVASTSREYGEENPQFELTFAGGPGMSPGQPAVSCQATAASPAGSYAITVGQGTMVYTNVTFVGGTLTITPAPLNVDAGNYAMTIGETLPTFKAIYDGWKLSDSEASLTVKPTFTCNLPTPLVEGEYVVTVSGAQSPNYTFTYENGLLTVFPANGIAHLTLQNPADIYTLTGLKVRTAATTTAGLPAGVYLINGKKVVVK